jgi:hypothetical protein
MAADAERPAAMGDDLPLVMPVILTKPKELDAWMTAPTSEVLALQRPRAADRGPRNDRGRLP